MILTIDPSKEEPIYLQLKNQIVLGIASGQLLQNDSLPTVRQLAADTQMNAMTVNKAYQLLKQEGYIIIDRRKGAVVKVAPLNDDIKRQIKEELGLMIAKAATRGISRQEFLSMCNQIYDNISIQ